MNQISDKKLKNILYVLIGIYAISLIISFYYNISKGSTYGIMMTAVAMITPCIVPLAFRIFHLRKVYEIYIIWIGFTYFASLIGSGFRGYSYVGYDKILHFLSGFLAMLFAIILFFYLRQSNRFSSRRDLSLFIVFINAINMSIAVLWEVYEYILLVVFNYDCINHYTQGVHDSLTDMIWAIIAGSIVTIYILYLYWKRRSNSILILCNKFYLRNIKNKKDSLYIEGDILFYMRRSENGISKDK